MALFLLTIAGLLSLVLIIRSIATLEHDGLRAAVLQLVFGVFSFIVTAHLSQVID